MADPSKPTSGEKKRQITQRVKAILAPKNGNDMVMSAEKLSMLIDASNAITGPGPAPAEYIEASIGMVTKGPPTTTMPVYEPIRIPLSPEEGPNHSAITELGINT
jgi:hypothetical protein